MLLYRILHFLKGPNPLHPEIWEGRLAPMQFRLYQPEDMEQCLKIYELNEPERFPPGVKDMYKKALRSKPDCFLVCEKDGRIICTGGLEQHGHLQQIVFCCGLVHPEFHGRGYGTALTLARLALLNPRLRHYYIFIFAVAKSIEFYRRMGFRPYEDWIDPAGRHQPSAILGFTDVEILQCRKLLNKNGITIPEITIPTLAPTDRGND